MREALMNLQFERLRDSKHLAAACLAFLLVLIFPSGSRAQAELRADKQLFHDTTHGSMSLKEGPGHELYLLASHRRRSDRNARPADSGRLSGGSGGKCYRRGHFH